MLGLGLLEDVILDYQHLTTQYAQLHILFKTFW